MASGEKVRLKESRREPKSECELKLKRKGPEEEGVDG